MARLHKVKKDCQIQGDSIKQNGLLGGVMTLLVGLGLMKRKKKKDENDQDDSQA